MEKKPERKGSGEDFSILLGTRRSDGDVPDKDVKKPEEPKSKPPEPEEPVEKKTVRKENLKDLLKKKEEIGLFLASLEEAHLSSKMPEYTYDKLKKKGELDLINTDGKIKKMGFKPVKKEGDALDKNISEIKAAINSLKKEKRIDTEYNQKASLNQAKVKELEIKLNELSKNLQQVSRKLSQKIKEVAVTEDVEITENVKVLKKEIDDIRSRLSEFVRRTDIENIVLRPSIGLHKTPEIRPVSVVPLKEKVVKIKNLSGFVGKSIIVECNVNLFNHIGEGKTEMYWYRIEDDTGNSILTSYEKIKGKKVKMLGKVRKTKSNSFYILFRKLV